MSPPTICRRRPQHIVRSGLNRGPGVVPNELRGSGVRAQVLGRDGVMLGEAARNNGHSFLDGPNRRDVLRSVLQPWPRYLRGDQQPQGPHVRRQSPPPTQDHGSGVGLRSEARPPCFYSATRKASTSTRVLPESAFFVPRSTTDRVCGSLVAHDLLNTIRRF